MAHNQILSKTHRTQFNDTLITLLDFIGYQQLVAGVDRTRAVAVLGRFQPLHVISFVGGHFPIGNIVGGGFTVGLGLLS